MKQIRGPKWSTIESDTFFKKKFSIYLLKKWSKEIVYILKSNISINEKFDWLFDDLIIDLSSNCINVLYYHSICINRERICYLFVFRKKIYVKVNMAAVYVYLFFRLLCIYRLETYRCFFLILESNLFNIIDHFWSIQ